jgi:preprotein translocase subunit SecY
MGYFWTLCIVLKLLTATYQEKKKISRSKEGKMQAYSGLTRYKAEISIQVRVIQTVQFSARIKTSATPLKDRLYVI